MLKHFTGSFVFAALCFAAAAAYGYAGSGTLTGALAVLWICFVLSVLEVSLSFDNAVVNATVLEEMSPVWQRRFLTWGIIIAVFGMRIVFPLVIVMIAGGLGPLQAVSMAMNDPSAYERVVSGAHTSIMGFGGAFLMLVGLKFFFDAEREHDWIGMLERPLKACGGLEAFAIVAVLLLLVGLSSLLAGEAMAFLTSGIFGIAAYYAVDWLSALLGDPEAADGVKRAGLGAFLYLEVLDASFSFDGVIGAFALSNNLIVIALGLGVGAMFVRSMTIFLVRQGTLAQFRYLEHGAFYAIVALAAIMLVSPLVAIPEAVTGLVGAGLIGLSLVSSIRHNRANPVAAVAVPQS